MQQAGAVDARDRAAAGADRVDFDRRAHAFVAADVEHVGEGDAALAHQDHVAARAADLHRDQVAGADRVGIELHRADAGGGAGDHQGHRAVAELLDRDGARVALDQQQRHFQATLGEAVVEGAQVGDRARRHIGVQHRRRAALVFAHDRRDRTGDRDGEVAVSCA
jgi:hypothetical protein